MGRSARLRWHDACDIPTARGLFKPAAVLCEEPLEDGGDLGRVPGSLVVVAVLVEGEAVAHLGRL
jgi:hypothetical protein